MKNFKETWNGYKTWVKEGNEKKYDCIMTLLVLPLIIILCSVYYLLGKFNTETKYAIKELEKEVKKLDDLPDGDDPIVATDLEPEQKDNKYAFDPDKYYNNNH